MPSQISTVYLGYVYVCNHLLFEELSHHGVMHRNFNIQKKFHIYLGFSRRYGFVYLQSEVGVCSVNSQSDVTAFRSDYKHLARKMWLLAIGIPAHCCEGDKIVHTRLDSSRKGPVCDCVVCVLFVRTLG